MDHAAPATNGDLSHNGEKTFSDESYRQNRPVIAFIMGHFFLRYLNLLYKKFDGDILLPIVFGEVAHHNLAKCYSRNANWVVIRSHIENLVRNGKAFEPGNAHSISEATGIPRETVRRKIDKLVSKGWLLKSPQAEVVITGTFAGSFAGFNKNLLSELLEAADCIRSLLEGD